MKRIDYNTVKTTFEDRGYRLLDKTYFNNRTPLRYECPEHPDKYNEITYYKLTTGQGCPYCANRGTIEIEEAKDAFIRRGFDLLETEYVNSRTKMHYRCSKHPNIIQSINWNNFQQGCGCAYCAGNIKHTINQIKKEFAQAGFDLISTNFINIHEKLEYRCRKTNEIHFIRFHDFQQGRRCPCCIDEKKSQKNRQDIESVRQSFAKHGYELLTKDYRNAHQPLRFKCPNHPDKRITITWNSFSKGGICKWCVSDTNKKQSTIYK